MEAGKLATAKKDAKAYKDVYDLLGKAWDPELSATFPHFSPVLLGRSEAMAAQRVVELRNCASIDLV